MMKRLAWLVLLALSGCAQVKAWERGALAHPAMDPEHRALEHRSKQHMILARETTAGAAGEAGGGCGCR